MMPDLLIGHSAFLGMRLNARFYNGQSMNGTFQPGDSLIITKVKAGEVCVGDVVIFNSIKNGLGKNDEWVHRVMDIRQGHFVTRGDNNPYNDISLVSDSDIIGKVTRIFRKGKIYLVMNGRWGFLMARCLHARHPLKNLLRNLFGKYYRWLKRSELLSYIWKPKFCKLTLKVDKGLLVKYLSNNHVVACWWTEQDRFVAARPFDLVIPHPKDLQE